MKNNDLELSIISCLLFKPELMKQVIVKDEHFKKHYRVWRFINAVYEKFGTLDIDLMYSVCSNKSQWTLMAYIEEILEYEPVVSNFMKYQERLIEMSNEEKKETEKINQIYYLANKLLARDISINDFEQEIERVVGEN